MLRVCFTGLVMTAAFIFGGTTVGHAQEFPQPTKEHKLLQQFVGDWDVVAETVAAPGQESIRSEGVESSQMIGGFWLVGNGKAEMLGIPVTNVLTLGYNPKSQQYVGTFFCSLDSTLWQYRGTMDDSGKKLTLETEGPSPLDPTKTAKYREIMELKDKDHKVFTSYLQAEDGSWVKFVTMDYRRRQPGSAR